jgi:formylglycine-generating enzyme required for sulfatase activity
MVWVPGGSFRMGSEDFYPEERSVHRVEVGRCRSLSIVPVALVCISVFGGLGEAVAR